MVAAKGQQFCQGRCQEVHADFITVYDDKTEKRKGKRCGHCEVLHLDQATDPCLICKRAGKGVKMLETGSDHRCSECLGAHIKFYTERFGKVPRPTMVYGCPFCREVTTWSYDKEFAICHGCGARGTHAMQVCKQCHKKNYIYTNRGEMCPDCIELVPQEHQFSPLELIETHCENLCDSVQKFAPYLDKENNRIGQQCLKCHVVEVQKEQICSECNVKCSPMIWHKGNNVCRGCFQSHKEDLQKLFLHEEKAAGGETPIDPQEQTEQGESESQLGLYPDFCAFCVEMKMHRFHGNFAYCEECNTCVTTKRQLCLGDCNKENYIYLNRGNRCYPCIEKAHNECLQQPVNDPSRCKELYCFTCKQMTPWKPRLQIGTTDTVKAAVCTRCNFGVLKTHGICNTCPPSYEAKQLYTMPGMMQTHCSDCFQRRVCKAGVDLENFNILNSAEELYNF